MFGIMVHLDNIRMSGLQFTDYFHVQLQKGKYARGKSTLAKIFLVASGAFVLVT